MRVAVLGTGTMGAGMARSLLRAGLDVTVWNRTRDRAGPLAADGARVAGSPADAVRDADAVLTMLFDAAAVLAVAREAATAWPDGAVWVQAATVGLDGIAAVSTFAAGHGIALLDAPVLGTKQPAHDGQLVPLVAGDPERIRQVQPVLDAIGGKTVTAGQRIGQGTALKLACNAYVAAVTAAVAQSIGLAAALGSEPSLVLEAIGGGPLDSPYAQLKGTFMVEGEYPPSFAVDGVLKDVRLMIDAAEGAGFPLELLRALEQLYDGASRAGDGNADVAAVARQFLAGSR